MLKTFEGGDYSKYQRGMTTFANDDFCIFRVGYRGYGYGDIVLDECFRDFTSMAQSEGKPLAMYFYSGRTSRREAQEEARFCLAEAAKLDIRPWAIFIDCEETKGRLAKNTMRTWQTIRQTFCDTIKQGGYKPGVYASESWFVHLNVPGALRWVAHWGVYQPGCGWDIHQFINNCTIYGIRTDRNRCQQAFWETSTTAQGSSKTDDTALAEALIDIFESARKKIKEVLK